MNEAEWLASNDPARMLNYLVGRKNSGGILTWLGVSRRDSTPRPVCVTDRKLRWFAIACCRRIWFLLQDERSQRAIETCERYADGMASEEELAASQAEAGAAADSMQTIPAAEYMTVALAMGSGGTGKTWSWAARAAAGATSRDAAEAATSTLSAVERAALECAMQWQNPSQVAEVAGPGRLASLLRDLFGPLPFRLFTISESVRTWNDGAVRRLAEAAYTERQLPNGHLDPVRLAVLADALEEFGCMDADLLGHLRSAGPHVRGCWPVDLLLDKKWVPDDHLLR